MGQNHGCPLDRHVAYLDRIAVDIRLQFGFAISRAELIRALIEAAAQSGVVLSDASNIKEMIAMLAETWAGANREKSASASRASATGSATRG